MPKAIISLNPPIRAYYNIVTPDNGIDWQFAVSFHKMMKLLLTNKEKIKKTVLIFSDNNGSFITSHPAGIKGSGRNRHPGV
jgi:hypothetical protein